MTLKPVVFSRMFEDPKHPAENYVDDGSFTEGELEPFGADDQLVIRELPIPDSISSLLESGATFGLDQAGSMGVWIGDKPARIKGADDGGYAWDWTQEELWFLEATAYANQ